MFSSFVLTLVIVFLLLLGLGSALFFYLYWWRIQRCTPQLDGTLTLPGLEQPVEIRRDKHGIPHIYAQSQADLLRAQGFIHAQDRLWQMEQNRRIARGTLAEIFGEAALEADRFSRIVGLWRAAEAELNVIDDETRQLLAHYAEGVNAYMAQRPGRLAAEFNLLRVQPEPWTVLDTIGYGKVVGWALSLNWESELTRLLLVNQVGPHRAAELEADYPTQSPLTLEGVGSETLTRLLSLAGLLLNHYDLIKPWLGVQTEGQGSNSWVVAPKASLNRRPLLGNDPHMGVVIPSTWYEWHLHAPDYQVSGVSFPGMPGVIIGHNEQIAWGLTNAMVDVQDLYLERAHPADPTQFEYNGQWEQAQVIEEVIQVRRRPDHVERVIITRHGPLINTLLTAADGLVLPNINLALRWGGHEPGHGLRAIRKLNQARNWAEFSTALVDWSIPAQNITYADAEGNIGYRLAGLVPVRDRNLGLTPAPGWTDHYEWSGFIPAEQLPQLYNPPSGKIVTANNKLVGDDYPYFLGAEFDPGWRAARLEELLQQKERYTVRDMEAMQLDTLSKYAQGLNPWLTISNSEEPWEKTALANLRKWNFRMDAESEAATVFHHYLICLLDLVYGDKLGSARRGYLGMSNNPLFVGHGFMLRAEHHLLTLLNEQDESFWYLDAQSGRQRTREELLQAALTQAALSLRANAGESTLRWAWGRNHQLRYVHPLGSARLVRNLFNRGPFPVAGDATTPNMARHAPQLPLGLVQIIAGYRQIYEVGSWDRSQTINSVGQSGHPLSAHYDDQIVLWREGLYHAMPWSEEAVQKATVYRLRLEPTG